MFLYSTLSSPWDYSRRFTLHPLANLFIHAPSRLSLSGKHSATLRENNSFTYMPLFVARYLFIQLSEPWQRRRTKIEGSTYIGRLCSACKNKWLVASTQSQSFHLTESLASHVGYCTSVTLFALFTTAKFSPMFDS